ELSGVFGGPPSLASNSAMRAFNAFTCASNSSMRSSLAAICARSWSIRANSGDTGRAPSLLGESFFLCGMASVNQLAAVGSTPKPRVTTPQKVSSYDLRPFPDPAADGGVFVCDTHPCPGSDLSQTGAGGYPTF